MAKLVSEAAATAATQACCYLVIIPSHGHPHAHARAYAHAHMCDHCDTSVEPCVLPSVSQVNHLLTSTCVTHAHAHAHVHAHVHVHVHVTCEHV